MGYVIRLTVIFVSCRDGLIKGSSYHHLLFFFFAVSTWSFSEHFHIWLAEQPVKYVGQVLCHLLSHKEMEAGSHDSFSLPKVMRSKILPGGIWHLFYWSHPQPYSANKWVSLEAVRGELQHLNMHIDNSHLFKEGCSLQLAYRLGRKKPSVPLTSPILCCPLSLTF